jgi:hypothetical protein
MPDNIRRFQTSTEAVTRISLNNTYLTTVEWQCLIALISGSWVRMAGPTLESDMSAEPAQANSWPAGQQTADATGTKVSLIHQIHQSKPPKKVLCLFEENYFEQQTKCRLARTSDRTTSSRVHAQPAPRAATSSYSCSVPPVVPASSYDEVTHPSTYWEYS